MAGDDDREQTWADFGDAVNMTAAELPKWLDDDRSKSVGQKSGGSTESTGHAGGRRIVDILDEKKVTFPTTPTRTCARWSATSNAISHNAPRVTSAIPHGAIR